MDKNAFTASQAFESYLWYHVLFLGASLFGLIVNKGTVRSNPFAIYKTTSMLCVRLGVRYENVVKQTIRLITSNTPRLTRNCIPCLGQTCTKLYTLSRTQIPYPVQRPSPYRPYNGVPPPPPPPGRYGCLELLLMKPEKTADIWRRYHWFPLQMTSEKRAQKSYTYDAPLPRSG